MLLSAILSIIVYCGFVTADNRKEDKLIATTVAGGPHGDWFDDFSFVNAASGHRRLIKLTIGPCGTGRAMTYIKSEFKDWTKPYLESTSVEHGTIGPGQTILALDFHVSEHIREIVVHTHKIKVARGRYKTRVSGMRISTLNQPAIECGVKGNKETVSWSLQADRAFLYFSGASGDAIDNIQAHSIPITDY